MQGREEEVGVGGRQEQKGKGEGGGRRGSMTEQTKQTGDGSDSEK